MLFWCDSFLQGFGSKFAHRLKNLLATTVITILPEDQACDYHDQINRVLELLPLSEMIGCDPPCAALVFSQDQSVSVIGNVDAHPALTALYDANLIGLTENIVLVVSVSDSHAEDALPSEVLNALYAIGTTKIVLVGADRSVVLASVSDSATSA